jgi:NadR type nicotinamide-nucleotide adenylyltransferase
MIRICFHGAESTGKSVLAERLCTDLELPWVPEYGREYAENNGTDFTMADLLAIAAGHEDRVRSLEQSGAALAILDTDALMTAAWAEMLFGEVPAALLGYPKAVLYLLFEPDVPWVADSTRFFGSPDRRVRFAATAEAMLLRAGVAFERIGGTWPAREAQVRAALAVYTGAAHGYDRT